MYKKFKEFIYSIKISLLVYLSNQSYFSWGLTSHARLIVLSSRYDIIYHIMVISATVFWNYTFMILAIKIITIIYHRHMDPG